MKSFSKFMILVALVLVLGGIGFLAAWDIPAPINNVEKVLPDDRFPR